MKKHCTLLRKSSLSPFLKEVSQATLISELLPDYTLTWEHPIDTDVLLLLDVAVNPVQHAKYAGWLSNIPVVQCLPGTIGYWKRIKGLKVEEITL